MALIGQNKIVNQHHLVLTFHPSPLSHNIPSVFSCSVAALERGGAPAKVSKGEGGQAEGSEEEEGASSSFNVDKLKAETKTPFRTVSS